MDKKSLAASIIAIAITIILMLVLIFFIDTLQERTVLFIKGCAGLSATISVIFVTIFLYRYNTECLSNRNKR